MKLTDKQRRVRADACWDSLGCLPERLRAVRDEIVQALPGTPYPCVCARGQTVTFQWIGDSLPPYVLATIAFDGADVAWTLDAKLTPSSSGRTIPAFVAALAPLCRPARRVIATAR